MVLRLSTEQLQAISTHAERTYPDECCGVLFGHVDRQSVADDRIVLNVWALPNAWDADAATQLAELAPPIGAENNPIEATKSRRYWIDPKDMLGAQRFARDRQIDIIGIYHSHPNHPAIPSECDRLCAWSQYSYVIASVQNKRTVAIRSWMLDGEHQFQPEVIITTGIVNK